MSLLKGSVLCFLLTVHLQLGTNATPTQKIKNSHANTRPLELIHKLISGQPTAIDRRKAVTIGFNRWLRPLTFQVPDMLTNLIPASSNLIKVHDDSKNKTNESPTSEQKPNAYNQQAQPTHPMMGYDPLQLITNFDQSAFLKGLPPNSGPMGIAGYGFPPNSSFAFDEAQLANAPLFGMQPTAQHPFGAGQASLTMQLNDKPYQPSVPLFQDPEEPNYHNQQQPLSQSHNQDVRHKKSYYQDYYNPNEEDSGPTHAQTNQHRYNAAGHLSDDQPKQTYGDHMSESYRNKEYYQNPRSVNYQGDYYPREPHHRVPHLESGSGNYDYTSGTGYNEPSSSGRDNFYNSMGDPAPESGEKLSYGFKKHTVSMAYGAPANDYDHGGSKDTHQQESSSTAVRPYYLTQHSSKEQASTERPYYRDYSPLVASNSFGNDSKHSSADLTATNDFFAHMSKTSSDSESGDPKGQNTKLGHSSEPASYSSYFATGFHSAASMLNPVVVKNEPHNPPASTEERSTIGANSNFGDKVLPIVTNNGINVFPSAQMKANMPRPVASRIKEFFKNMLTQKY